MRLLTPWQKFDSGGWAHLSALYLFAFLTLSTGYVWAEDRALLIGIGAYQIKSASLPGIQRDLQLMQEVAGRLGYKPEQVRVLKDHRATLADVERALERWLVEDVVPDDRVLIYFSGHGSRNKDEDGDETDDEADEVLLMHDARVTQHNGNKRLEGVLLDDRFNQLLRQIPSRNVLVLVDACHSGTATKFFDWQSGLAGILGRVKFFSYPGMPEEGVRGSLALDDDNDVNYVAIGATEDNEEALPSEQGSYFTRGIHYTVMQAGGRSLSPRQLLQGATRYIQQHVERNGWFHPQLSGNTRLADIPIFPRG